MSYFFIFLISFFLTLILILGALKIFPLLKLMDKPAKYGLFRKSIPYSGGILIFIVFVSLILIFLDIDKHILGLLAGAFLILFVSFLDDFYNLSPKLRLFVQFLAALTLIVSGIGIDFVRSPFDGLINLESWQIPVKFGNIIYNITIFADLFTIVWVLGMMNTVNWMDGVNGMASGISFIAFLILFFLSTREGMHYIDQTQVASLSIILAGTSMAFVLFEFYPAKILMGDSGSMFLGFMIAVLAIFSGGKVATAILVMGVPILDAVWVVARRLKQGRSPLKGDLQHFHHRLLKAGFSQRSALLMMYFFSLSFGVVALFLDNALSKSIAMIVLIIIMIFLGVWVVRREVK